MSDKTTRKLQGAALKSVKPIERKAANDTEKAQARAQPPSGSGQLVKRRRKIPSKSLLAKFTAYFKKNETKFTPNSQFYSIEFEADYMPDLPGVAWLDVGDSVYVYKTPTSQVIRRPRRRAVVIGIGYQQSKFALRGTLSDAVRFYRFLVDLCGFKIEEVLYRTDADTFPVTERPYSARILSDMQWLVKDAMPGDVLVFFFSGHGTRVTDKSGDEQDGYDEAIVALAGADGRLQAITDDVIKSIMVSPLPPGCSLLAFFDCCHSGTIMDLPVLYSRKGSVKNSPVVRMLDYASMDKPHVLSITGCRDSQSSREIRTEKPGEFGGDFTTAILRFAEEKIKKHTPFSYLQMYHAIREAVGGSWGKKQNPQMASLFVEDLLGTCCLFPPKDWNVGKAFEKW